MKKIVFAVLVGFAVIMTGTSFAQINMKNYVVTFQRNDILPGSRTNVSIFGYAVKNPSSNIVPMSFMEIRTGTGTSEKVAYRFSPSVPKWVGYARQLRLEKADILKTAKTFFIVSSWGETGADYFGTHPVVIRFNNSKFGAFNFYQGNIADKPEIRKISWTRKDFTAVNYFNASENIKTVMTQSVNVMPPGKIMLGFIGDNLPKASRHKLVNYEFPLIKDQNKNSPY